MLLRLFLISLIMIPELADASSCSNISDLYVKSIGNPSDQGVVFIHGGPGFNSFDFEVTTAESLANKGFRVVVYDQRGQGRSAPALDSTTYTYDQYTKDLMDILTCHGIEHPILLGHSHGGPIAISFGRNFPSVAKKIVLIGAPVNWHLTIMAVLDRAEKLSQHEPQSEIYKMMVETKAGYEKYAALDFAGKQKFMLTFFDLAGQIGSYFPRSLSPEAIELYKKVFPNGTSPVTVEEASTSGFIANEDYMMKDFSGEVSAKRNLYCGIYGDEDRLFSKVALNELQENLTEANGQVRIQLIKGASHAVFIHQRELFFDALKSTCDVGI